MIESVQVYRTKGKQFDRLKDAITYRENLIDEFLRKSPGYYEIPLKMRIAFMESILNRRKELIDLLDYSDDDKDVE